MEGFTVDDIESITSLSPVTWILLIIIWRELRKKNGDDAPK